MLGDLRGEGKVERADFERAGGRDAQPEAATPTPRGEPPRAKTQSLKLTLFDARAGFS